jgi:hypothetical protein
MKSLERSKTKFEKIMEQISDFNLEAEREGVFISEILIKRSAKSRNTSETEIEVTTVVETVEDITALLS